MRSRFAALMALSLHLSSNFTLSLLRAGMHCSALWQPCASF